MVGTPWRSNAFPLPPRGAAPGLLHPPSFGILGKPHPNVPNHTAVAAGLLRSPPNRHIQPAIHGGILGSPGFGRGSPLAARQRSNDRLTRPQMNRSPRQYNQQNNHPKNNVAVAKKLSKKEIQEKAMATEVPREFYDRVKAVLIKSKTSNIALEFAQKKFCSQIKRKYPMVLLGSGGHVCSICKVGHTNRKELENHYDTLAHRQLEEIYDLLKEQAFLIFDGKVKLPNAEEKKNGLELVITAEQEMSLNAKELDLDGYILGIYESVMRQYWPVPKSTHYCRICNYAEFSSDVDLQKHLKSRSHKDYEASYDEAFCLYCQHHNVNKSKMIEHEKTEKHKKVRGLMDSAKEQAIKQWHIVNNKPLPKEIDKLSSKESKSSSDVKTGSKRTNNSFNEDMSSPTKKRNENFNSVKSESNHVTNSKEKTDDNMNWFVPVYGFMCISCRIFLSNSTEQKNHASLPSHRQAVEKLKKKIIDEAK